MEIQVKHKYFVFPVNPLATVKRLTFKKNTEIVYAINIKLDYVNPDFNAYIDVSRFMDENLDISIFPGMKLSFDEADTMEIENLYHEPMRPQVHFSTKNGWLNDPNGLIYLDGTYHMFYQYNPAEPFWDNMHWGHAVSKDLIHWEEKDTALFMDDRGMMYSGSAVVDEKNLLGKNDGDNKTAILFYTTTTPFCQNLSFSVDGFKTIERFDGNPIIAHVAGRNRDPKVTYCDELGCYILVFYLEEDIYLIYKSEDLTHWEKIQEIHLDGDNECPDIFPIVDNDGNRKWVLIGAHDRYLIGTVDASGFVPEQEAKSLHYGVSAYAGQSFSNLPNGRIVRIVWDRWSLPANGFNGQMGIPMELTLCKCKDTYYLEANPVKEIEGIYNGISCYEDVAVTNKKEFKIKLEDAAHLFKIKGVADLHGKLQISIFGRSIALDFDQNEVKLGDSTAPITITKNNFDLTIVVDRCSMELFMDGGKAYMSGVAAYTLSDRNIPYFSLTADGEINLKKIEINSLKSIWER